MGHRDHLREKAEHCASLAIDARTKAERASYLKMQECWLRLAELDDWLNSRISPFHRNRKEAEAR
jgi:hypothetical protein